MPETPPLPSHRKGAYFLLWLLFVCIAGGLGYPSLNRYDPRVQGPDQEGFHDMVVSGMRPERAVGHRMLVPWLARPIYLAAKGHVGTWNPVFFALLVVNAALVGACAVLLIALAQRVGCDVATALLAALLYFVNFAVPNYFLAAYVDSAEALAVIWLTYAIVRRQWFAMPLIAMFGTAGKETFFPISVAFVAGWMLPSLRARRIDRGLLSAAVVLGVLGLAVTTTLLSMKMGSLVWPWTFAHDLGSNNPHPTFAGGLFGVVANRDIWYVFLWILPLGLWHVRSMPVEWRSAVVAACALVLLLGAYDDSGPNIDRPLFSIAAPLLVLSAAKTLQMVAGRTAVLRITAGSQDR
jgi:hypothetical protein